jgi:hypothetical protein
VSDTPIAAEEDGVVPAYVAARIRRPPPPDCHVLPRSTPVVAFGDPRRSAAATLGLNPSRIEFEENGVELTGKCRRFETLASLGVERLDDASDEVITRVWNRCNRYFHGNPYAWFDRLEDVLLAVDASYFGGTACHLDLSQWATDPTWNGLARNVRQRLVAEDAEFLLMQLRSEPIGLLLLNGRGVINAFQAVLGGRLRREGETVSDASVTTQFYSGRFGEVQVIGWSTNLQSSFGVTNVLRARLAERVWQLSTSGLGATR